MDFDNYRQHDGLALARLVARGEVSAAELLETAIARAEVVNPALNAIIHPLYERARRRATGDLGGAFAGVPFLVKDLFQDLAGAPATAGCKALKAAGFQATEDQEYIRRLEAAGAVIFGKTNTPELGSKGVTEPEAFGATRNPWDLTRTPGGSSGGSAAAVAAGIVPAAGANDGGGSIRIPAACCGLFGLKSGRGRTPMGPPMAEMMHGANVNHVVSRSVRDSAVLLDALHGAERGSGIHLAPPQRAYLASAGLDPAALTIGLSSRSPIGTAVDPEAERALADTAALLESLGHRVHEAEPQIDGPQLAKDFFTMWFGQIAASVAEVKARTGCGEAGFELDTRALARLGHALRADEYVAANNRWQGYARALARFHERFDCYLTPTLAGPPARIGAFRTPLWQRAVLRTLLPLGGSRLLLKTGVVDQMAQDNLKWVPYTQLANLTGVPAMSVPLHWTADGLPLGVQFVGRVGGESQLFELAGQLERARPWFHRLPRLS